MNIDNAVTVQDIFDYLARWFAGGQGTIDRVSHPSVNNPYGYCGYYADAETVGMLGKNNGGLYHVRHRVYDPISGSFLQRDGAGDAPTLPL